MPPSAHWLSLSIWVPIVAGLAVLATGADKNAREARIIALVGAGLGFLVTIPLVAGFDTGTSAMQFVETAPWIDRFNVNYHELHGARAGVEAGDERDGHEETEPR